MDVFLPQITKIFVEDKGNCLKVSLEMQKPQNVLALRDVIERLQQASAMTQEGNRCMVQGIIKVYRFVE